MNKYLEKIAARVSTSKAMHGAKDIYTIQQMAAKKKRKKKKTDPVSVSRKWNRAPT